jgi:hypothetical protein
LIALFAMRLARARYRCVTTPVYIYSEGKARGKKAGFRIQESGVRRAGAGRAVTSDEQESRSQEPGVRSQKDRD